MNDGDTGDATATATIPTLAYNFQSDYGVVNGTPVKNLITAAQEDGSAKYSPFLRSISASSSSETANQGITVAVGDIRAVQGRRAHRPRQRGRHSNANNLAIVNNYYNWGGHRFRQPLHAGGDARNHARPGLGAQLRPASRRNHGKQHAGRRQPGRKHGSSDTEASFPDNGDIVTGQYLYPQGQHGHRPLQVRGRSRRATSAPRPIAQRLQNASFLNTVLMLYDGNRQSLPATTTTSARTPSSASI